MQLNDRHFFLRPLKLIDRDIYLGTQKTLAQYFSVISEKILPISGKDLILCVKKKVFLWLMKPLVLQTV